ncbi:MAG: hypothetical protein ACM3Q1_05280 [Bacteroidales bacterium]
MPFDDDMVAKDCAGKVATLVSLFGHGGDTTQAAIRIPVTVVQSRPTPYATGEGA